VDALRARFPEDLTDAELAREGEHQIVWHTQVSQTLRGEGGLKRVSLA
jgi:hypothetical protein